MLGKFIHRRSDFGTLLLNLGLLCWVFLLVRLSRLFRLVDQMPHTSDGAIMVLNLVVSHRTQPAARLLDLGSRLAWALAIRRGHGDSESSWLDETGLHHFIATSGRTAAQHARGHARHTWLVHEDHLLHLAGPGSDCLLLKYPLTGEFQFSVETQAGGRPGTDGGVSYAGLGYLLNGCGQLLTVADDAGGAAKVSATVVVDYTETVPDPWYVPETVENKQEDHPNALLEEFAQPSI
ncbi:MAG: hypothetical protein O3C40_37855, partial [Planctomycetota bacterium]|nr:hypothetical protein [Planctomycetota bacterium]